jgi:uncharacterized membrane protein YqhA
VPSIGRLCPWYGIYQEWFDPQLKTYPSFVSQLREQFCAVNKQKLKVADLKKILEKMSVDDENKLYFQKLFCYYLVDQFLLCGVNPKLVRVCYSKFVNDLDIFEKINWPKTIFDHLCESLKDLKKKVAENPTKQHISGVVLQFLRYDFHNIKNVSFEHFHIHITHI